MHNKRQDIISLYKKSKEKSLSDIKRILIELNLFNEETIKLSDTLFKKSIDIIINKWSKKEKYLRTEFVLEAFSDEYPKDRLELSVTIDAMINILDDLYDEEMSRSTKSIYLIEYLRIFALYGILETDKEFQKSMGNYINKLITLAISENRSLKLFAEEDNWESKIKIASDLLITRAMDIDIFIDLTACSLVTKEVQLIGRLFRAGNILKKDVADIEHDIDNDQMTLVTNIYTNDSKKLENFVRDVFNIFLNQARENLRKSEALSKENVRVQSKFYSMLENDFELAVDNIYQ